MTFWNNTQLHLPEDQYKVAVAAFEAGSFQHYSSYLDKSSKFENLLMKHGAAVDIHVGQTSEPMLPVISTEDQIKMALASLRSAH